MLQREENDRAVMDILSYVETVAPTDKDALNIFYQGLVDEGLAVCACGSTQVSRADGERTFVCQRCRQKTWFTSSILLCKARRFKAYLAAVLICEAGLEVTGTRLAALTGIVSATGLSIQKKFNTAISNQMPSDAPKISGKNLKAIIAKRTAITPVGRKPYAEQEEIDKQLLLEQELEEDAALKANGAETNQDFDPKPVSTLDNSLLDEFDIAKNFVWSKLSSVPISIDKIFEATNIPVGRIAACLTTLEMEGLVEEVPGSRFVKVAKSSATEAETSNPDLARSLALAAKDFVGNTIEYSHGVGRKSIQLKLAGWWCTLDRVRWSAGSVMRLCLTHPPVTGRIIMDYVSPPLLSIMLC